MVRAAPRPPARALVVAGLALALAGCGTAGGTEPSAPAAPAPTGTAAATVTADPQAGVAPVPDGRVPDAARVRSDGVALSAAGRTVAWLLPADPAAAVDVHDRPDGAADVSLRSPDGAATLGWLVAEEGVAPEVLADGSAVLRAGEAATAAVGAPAGGSPAPRWVAADGVLVLRGSPAPAVELLVGASALTSTTWGEAEGGRSLAVVPADWVRGGSLAGQEVLTAQLVAAEPEAGSASMRAQLWCHALGAPDKDAWNLEPWRPDVGTVTLLATRCNPTADDA